MTFSKMIHILNTFWQNKGCAIIPAYDVEIGAGTYHPAVTLGILGPDPLSIAFVQPSRRPADGRYGTNPNRLQKHHQYEVILKPSPVNVQELVLEIFQALGLDLKLHDVRFVEDNWESPTLGASGLGWEVWIDGMEVLQLTYFQHMGGVPCESISVEYAFGLERLILALSQASSIYEVLWSHPYTYGDLFYEQEVQWSQWNLGEAHLPSLQVLFQSSLEEGHHLVLKKLYRPAYDLFLRANHTFNLLNARKALSVIERTDCIKKLRDLSSRIILGHHHLQSI
jgi:glycyl-tRNA synthetase alpha chain